MEVEETNLILIKLSIRVMLALDPLIFLEDPKGEKIDFSRIKYIRTRVPSDVQKYEITNVRYTSYKLIRFTAPFIITIKRLLEAIFSRITFCESKEQGIYIKGFRLKLNSWSSKAFSLPRHIVSHLSHVCDCNCTFCYLKGDQFRVPFLMTLEEAKTRIKYFDLKNKRGLPRFINPMGEPFSNPYILDILKLTREKDPYSPIFLTTNGLGLNEEIIKKIAELKPACFEVSLNSTNYFYRQKIMGGKGHENITHTMRLLREYELCIIGSMVAWPSLPFSDIEESISFLEKINSLYAVIFLPGVTRFHNFSSSEIKNIKTHWSRVKSFYFHIKNKFRIPICVIPSAFVLKSIRSTVDGVMMGSPAEKAGIRPNDQIIEIEGESIFSREGFYKTMKKIYKPPKTKEVRMKIKRDGKIMDISIKDLAENEYAYPYRPKGYPIIPDYLLGILMASSIDISAIGRLRKFIQANSLSRIAVFTSPLIRIQLMEVEKYVNLKEFFGKCDVNFFSMKNFFWGGNIIAGDLMMVDDFCKLLKSKKIKRFSPEVVAIPSTFLCGWGRDYSGKVYLEIERKTGYKVFLIPCSSIDY